MNDSAVAKILDRISYIDYKPKTDDLIREMVCNHVIIHSLLSDIKENLNKEHEVVQQLEKINFIEQSQVENIHISIEKAYKTLNELMPQNSNDFDDNWRNKVRIFGVKTQTEKFYDQFKSALKEIESAKQHLIYGLYATKSIRLATKNSLENNRKKIMAYGKFFLMIYDIYLKMHNHEVLNNILTKEEKTYFELNKNQILHKINTEMGSAVELMIVFFTTSQAEEQLIEMNDKVVHLLQNFNDKYDTIFNSIKTSLNQIQALKILEGKDQNSMKQILAEIHHAANALKDMSQSVADVDVKKLAQEKSPT